MSAHLREHEELLAALSTGARAPTDPEVERRLRECERCAREWAEVQDAQRQLERLGAAERVSLEELADLGAAPGEDRVLSVLERLAATEPHGPKRRRSLVAALVAATLLVASALFWFLRDSGPPAQPTTLGEHLRIERPRGPVTSYAPFAWAHAGDADSYELRIYDAADTTRARPLLEKRLEETHWTPAPEDLERLPDRIFWIVDALDAYRNVLPGSSDSAEASRSP